MKTMSHLVAILLVCYAFNGYSRPGGAGHGGFHGGGARTVGHSGGVSFHQGGSFANMNSFSKSFYNNPHYSHIKPANHANFYHNFFNNHHYASVTNTGWNVHKATGYRRTKNGYHIYNSGHNANTSLNRANNLSNSFRSHRITHHNYHPNWNNDRHHNRYGYRHHHYPHHWWWYNHYPHSYYGGGLVYNDGDVYYDDYDNQTPDVQDSAQESAAEEQANQYETLANGARDKGKQELCDIYKQCASAEQTLAKAYKFGDRNLLEIGNRDLQEALGRLNSYTGK